MSTTTTLIGDRRRLALERASAARRHPARRAATRVVGPPPTAFYVIGMVVAVLVMLGLVMVLSASSISAIHDGESPWRLFNRQLTWALLGAVGLIVTARTPYHVWRRLVLPILVCGFGMMLLPFVPSLGGTVNGARAWVFVGGFGFQPSEFLKLAVLLYCADLLAKRQSEMTDLRRTMKPMLIVAGLAGMFCLAQGDLGSAIVLAAIVMAVAFVGGAPMAPLSAMGVAGAMFGAVFVLTSQRRFNRFTAFLDITGHRDHLSYQMFQARIGMATGGLLGTGIGNGPSKWGYLPLAHSDFIFAVIAEELGLIGVVGVIGAYVLLTYFGVQVALAAPDRFGTLLAGGIAAWLAVQAIINVGGVAGVMPVTGLTLPFLSAGGSSLFVSMTAIGLVLNVARQVRPAR